jgi:type IV secretion system protein TrbE
MRSSPPNGFFADGMMVYGALEKGGLVAKGFVLQPADRRGASIEHLNAYQDRIRSLLALLGPNLWAQFQWGCDGDYRTELTAAYREIEQIADPGVRRLRMRYWRRHWKKMQNRALRREQLALFLIIRIEAQSSPLATRDALRAHCEKMLAQLRAQFEELAETLRTVFGADTAVTPMDDLAHFTYFARFLNPSFSERFDLDCAEQFNPALSIQENCWNGDGVGLQKIGFYLDGRYHSIFTIKRWPDPTFPGIIYRLTGLDFQDYRVTVNVEPLPLKREVDKEEKAIERLRGEYRGSERHSLLVAIGKKERKIESLSTGFIRPFSVTYIIRTWDETEQGLAAKCSAIKNAINGMNGAQYYECARPSTAKKLFFASWPGWNHSAYRHRCIYGEDTYLADMLPFSATFTGQLDGAEVILEGAQKNLVGLRTFLGSPPSPQHTVLLGATGAGKSRFMHRLLVETAARYLYTVLIEEGLSYETFTRMMGERPIVLHPDSDLTINYFDTGGVPLGQLQIATAVALVARMIGESADAEAQQIRQATLGQYINQLYQDTFDEWSKRHRELIPSIQRMACATHRWKQKMGVGTTELEAFADLRDRTARSDDEAQQFIAGIPESEITAFVKSPQTERLVMAVAHAHYSRKDYPVHSSLVELMRFARFPEHKKEHVDHLATLLSAWCASGQYGRLFDGETNISLTGKVAHFELGLIPEQAVELKTAAGLLITGFTRQHIISLPRDQWKRIVYEELARFLDVPGGEKIVEESYAQLRKFNCWTAAVVQQYAKFKKSRIRPVVVGNCKQFWFMRQFDRSDVEDIARDVGLPESVCGVIQSYPLLEQQREGKKFSSVCFFSPVTDPPLCGTVRNIELSEAEEADDEPAEKSA